MQRCDAAIADDVLVDYWAGDVPPDQADGIEAHVFACRACAARLERVASMSLGLATLVREGRVSGIISRALVNRLQRDGVSLRMYLLSPGEIVPCSVFSGDEVVVASLRADLTGVRTAALLVTGPGNTPVCRFDDIPVAAADREVLWAMPGATLRQWPSTRLHLVLSSADEGHAGHERHAVLGEYVLEHTASGPAAG